LAIQATWVDGGLANYALNVLTALGEPIQWGAPYFSAVPLDPTLDLAALNPDAARQTDLRSLWSFSLDPTHFEDATATWTILFPPADAGNIYYGIALYTPTGVLSWYLIFDSPYVVLAGGSTLTVTVHLSFSDCAHHP
jgi:hypothetical protein